MAQVKGMELHLLFQQCISEYVKPTLMQALPPPPCRTFFKLCYTMLTK